MSKELTAFKYLKGNPYIQEDRYSMESLSIIENALKRNEPMKPINKGKRWSDSERGAFFEGHKDYEEHNSYFVNDLYCGNCKESIENEDFKFCPDCGQKLEWSD